MNCKHCCSYKDKDEYEINYDSAKKIIDDAYDNLGIYKVILTGGESTLNKDFLKIAKYVKEKYLGLKILTNAVSLSENEKLYNELINLYPSEIQISLYSMNPEVHDKMTGVIGSHKKTLDVIKRLREKNITVNITCFQSSYNLDSYKEVGKFAKLLGVEANSPCLFVYNKKNNNLAAKLDRKNIEKYYIETIEGNKIRNLKKDDELICKAGTDRISIMANLDIVPCVYLEYVLGNYNSTDFKKLKNEILPGFKKEFVRKNLTECFKHDYCNYCFYCPTIAKFDTGFLKKSEIMCEDAKAYYNALRKIKNKEKEII